MIAELTLGDMVQTRDQGFQPLHMLQAIADAQLSHSQIVSVSPGAFGAMSEISLCGGQPVLLRGWLVTALFSDAEVLVRIGGFADAVHVHDRSPHSAFRGDTTFYQIGFEAPQLVACNGVWLASRGTIGVAAGTLPRRLLAAGAEACAIESGLFIRRSNGTCRQMRQAHPATQPQSVPTSAYSAPKPLLPTLAPMELFPPHGVSAQARAPIQQ